MRLNSRNPRRGVHVVECALVYPIVFFFTISLAVGASGVFRYQQVAHLAREAARYASTHAGEYQQENAAAITAGTLPNVTSDYIKNNIVQPYAFAVDLSQLQITVNFNTSNGSYGWDDTTDNGDRAPYSPKTVNGVTYCETNTVSVTVTYTWYPETGLVDPITLTSTSVMPVCY